MSKHVGHDHERGYRFHIVGIDAANQVIAIQYESSAWLSDSDRTEQLPCAEFVERLAAGRFEIRAIR